MFIPVTLDVMLALPLLLNNLQKKKIIITFKDIFISFEAKSNWESWKLVHRKKIHILKVHSKSKIKDCSVVILSSYCFLC